MPSTPPASPPAPRRDSFAVLIVIGVALWHVGGILFNGTFTEDGVNEAVFVGTLVAYYVVSYAGVAIALVGLFRALRLLEERLRTHSPEGSASAASTDAVG